MVFSKGNSGVYYMHGPGAIPIERAGITEHVRRAVKAACDSIYKGAPCSSYVLAYKYSSLLMLSISASSKQDISPAAIDFDAIKSAFISSMPEAPLAVPEVVFGSAWYPAPSLVKFLILVQM